MPRGRRSRPTTPSTLTPSPSPSPAVSCTRTRSRSLGPRPRRASFAAPSRSRSRSRKPSPRRRRSSSASSRPRPRSPSPPPRSRRQDLKDRVKEDAKDAKKDTALKTSLAFLGAVGAATYVASKYWPKGVIYGDKEVWEKEDVVRHHHGKPGARGPNNGPDGRHSPPRRPGYQKSRTAEAPLGPRRDRDAVVYEEVEVVKRPVPQHSRSEGVGSMVAQAGQPRPPEARRGGRGPDERAVPRTVTEHGGRGGGPQRNNAPPSKVSALGRPVREEYVRYDDVRR